jgi:hypothetical protein
MNADLFIGVNDVYIMKKSAQICGTKKIKYRKYSLKKIFSLSLPSKNHQYDFGNGCVAQLNRASHYG